jgi:hypothetical protein
VQPVHHEQQCLGKESKEAEELAKKEAKVKAENERIERSRAAVQESIQMKE